MSGRRAAHNGRRGSIRVVNRSSVPSAAKNRNSLFRTSIASSDPAAASRVRNVETSCPSMTKKGPATRSGLPIDLPIPLRAHEEERPGDHESDEHRADDDEVRRRSKELNLLR